MWSHDAGCLTINEKDLAKNGHLHTQQLKVLHISLWPSGQPPALALAAMVAWPTFLRPKYFWRQISNFHPYNFTKFFLNSKLQTRKNCWTIQSCIFLKGFFLKIHTLGGRPKLSMSVHSMYAHKCITYSVSVLIWFHCIRDHSYFTLPHF